MEKIRLALVANVTLMLMIAGACRKKDSIAGTVNSGTPAIINFYPQTGAADTVVAIYGNYFPEDKSKLTIKFGSTAATEIVAATANQITVKVPKQATPGKVKISVTVAGNEVIAYNEFLIYPTTWSNMFGGAGNENAKAIVRTADGGYVAAGETFSDTKGDRDVWVIKTDGEGNKLWQKTFGGQWDETATGIAVGTDNSIVISAHTTSNNSGDVGPGHGQRDAWLLKLDAAGNLMWQRTFGGANDEYAAGVTATGDGGFVFAGYTTSNNSGDVGPTKGSFDYWVVKINASGTLLWQKTFGGTGYDNANCITSQTDGSLIIAGSTYSNNSGDVGATKGSSDFWVIKLDALGNPAWKKTYGGINPELAYSIISTADGGCAVAGNTSSNNNGDVGPNHGNTDMWIVKLAADGSLQWQKTFGGYYDETAYALCAGPNSSLVAAGVTLTNNDGNVGVNHGREDAWIIKLSATGELLGQTTKGGAMDDDCFAITRVTGQGYVLAGYSVNNNGGVGARNNDIWLCKINEF